DSDNERKRQSEGSANAQKWDAYSPPTRPTNFRSIRDSVMVSGLFGGTSDTSDQPRVQTSPPSDSGAKNPLQAALAALSGSPKEAAPKRGPKPLLLNSSSLITPSGSRSSLSSRTPSRRPSPSPTPRPGDRFSISTTEGDDPITPGASGFVSLRRGPITNPRTAGYGPRDSMLSSRASTSGLSSPSLSSYGLSVEVEAPDEDGEYRSLRKQKSASLKNGFLIDQGKPGDQLTESTPLGVVKLNTSSDSSHDESTNGYISASSQMEQKEDPRSKRLITKPAPILTSAPPDIPEVQVITPRSGERSSGQSDDAAISKSPEAPNNLQSDLDLPILDPRVSIGSSLTRSRTPRVKKPRRSSHEDRTPRGVTRQRSRGSQEDRNRASIIGASGSEEEGARADVEDLDDIYTMY
ncbi:17077_t:CDS:1, partial [Acaulospora colombiana]